MLKSLANFRVHRSVCVDVALVVFLSLIRLREFMIFHDCGHMSFFPLRTRDKARWHQRWKSVNWNRVIGHLFGSVTYTPFNAWTEGHRYHHQHSNDLRHSQEGLQSAPWTCFQYAVMPDSSRWKYFLRYGGATYFTVNAWLSMLLEHRFISRWYENMGVLVWLAAVAWAGHCVGTIRRMLLLELAQMCLTASLGHALFHVQHTFEHSYKARDYYSAYDNCFLGCSFLQVGWPLSFFTLGIEYHHIHHLNPGVPAYRLQDCHNAAKHLFQLVPRVTLRSFLGSMCFALYNEDIGQYESVYCKKKKSWWEFD